MTSIVGSAAFAQAIAWPLGLEAIAATCIGIQWTAFIPAYYFRTEKFYDLTGSITFITTMLLSLKPQASDARQKIGALMVFAWTFRLGYYLFTRILQHGRDSRFDQVKHQPLVFLQYWTVQGLWVFLTALPVYILHTKKPWIGRPWPHALDIAGVIIWLLGFTIEVVADFQKHCFKNNSANRDKFITNGLWRYSRHPNYAGELTLWVGVFILASGSFDKGWDALAVLSPIFIALLLSQISVPMLEKGSDKRWIDNKDYKRYKDTTAVMFPGIY